MKIVTSHQMRQIEARCQQAGVPTEILMEKAGFAIARRVRHYLSSMVGVRVIIMVGPGNNGGDGLVAARHLHAWQARVCVYLCGERTKLDTQLISARDQGVPIISGSHDKDLSQLKGELSTAHIVVDAVLGTGNVRPIAGQLKDVLLEVMETRARRSDLKILAVDVPTGVNADTGATDAVCLSAGVTVALGYPKLGLFAFPGAANVGDLDVVRIGIPSGLDEDVGSELMTPHWAKSALPQRDCDAHKGSFGRTLVVAGSKKYVGAAYLAANAASRAGSGLVTVALPYSLQMAVAMKAPEPTYLPLPESSPGVMSQEAIALIIDSLPRYNSLLVGCGLGQDATAIELVEKLLCSSTPLPPTVVDADALNILSMRMSESMGWWDEWPSRAIVTPHPGEMSRLTGSPINAVQADRVNKARESAMKWGKITVLKGPYTIVAFPDGGVMVSPFVNPGLASAGTGDVLAGIIAGLLSQGMTLEDAASLGVYLHGAAGEKVKRVLGDTGVIAGDLLGVIPEVIKNLHAA